jgi:hypothetical protein
MLFKPEEMGMGGASAGGEEKAEVQASGRLG